MPDRGLFDVSDRRPERQDRQDFRLIEISENAPHVMVRSRPAVGARCGLLHLSSKACCCRSIRIKGKIFGLRAQRARMPRRQSVGSAAKFAKGSLATALPARIHPGDDRGPDCGVRPAPDQRSKVLQAHPDFAGIFDNARISGRHGLDERLNRLKRGDIVRSIDDRKRRRRHALRAYQLVDLQLASTKSILAIEPLNELMGEFAWKRNLVESPALNARMNCQRALARDAQYRIRQSRTDECFGRRQGAHLS